MATKIIGIEHKEGSFTNEKSGEKVTYDNYVLHYLTDERPNVKGMYAGHASVKTDKVQLKGFTNIEDILDHYVIFGFDMTATTPTINKIILDD